MAIAQHLPSAKSSEGAEERFTSYLSLPSRVQKGIDLRSVFKLRPSPFHTKRKELKSKIANS